MDIFTPVTLFQIILKSDVTKRNVLLFPYEHICQLLYQQRTISNT